MKPCLSCFADMLEIEKAVFVGHDWGATMCWRMCLYHPERVAAVCSVTIPYFPPSDQCTDLDALVAMMPQFAYLKLLGDSKATAEKLAKAPRRFYNAVFHHSAEIPRDLAQLIENAEHGSDSWYNEPSTLLSEEELAYYVHQIEENPGGFLGGCRYYGQWRRDFETELELPREIPHDALYIAVSREKNDEDSSHQQMVAGMTQLIPKLETKVVYEAGHWVLWEKKELVMSLLLEWLERVN
ncbi:hypothetical protein BBJ28_00002512 [Nothophytophthora sp. Chile5]|nr:hypothetical protein BBJ28_00002512 [Nothophytophthora sp. Chile5]